MNKVVCFTIDVEPDFGGLTNEHLYFGLDNLEWLVQIVRKYDIKITAFVTGQTIEDRPIILDRLREMNAEIEQHSYSHQVGRSSKQKDIEKGIESYERTFGRPPNGYRAPQGMITKEDLDVLKHAGVKFDSSIFPTFFPGRFNRLEFPTRPFFIGQSGIAEIPFSVLPKIRIPIGLSYMQILGFNSFKILTKVLGLPDLIIYGFHPYELGRVESYKRLPMHARVGYLRPQMLYHDPASIFESFVSFALGEGYESKYMIELYNDIKSDLTTWNWKGM
jgi:peptidoglycan/xylan/chitin deacetylase (PgdA/CDA1 family)